MNPDNQASKPGREELSDWLDKQQLCVIATVDDSGFPNAATVAFSHNDKFEFYIITDIESRKAHNIAHNNHAALTITNEVQRHTLQVEGEATMLAWDEFDEQIEHHHMKLPFTVPLRDVPGQTVYRITPKHARFTDITVGPWKLTEYSF